MTKIFTLEQKVRGIAAGITCIGVIGFGACMLAALIILNGYIAIGCAIGLFLIGCGIGVNCSYQSPAEVAHERAQSLREHKLEDEFSRGVKEGEEKARTRLRDKAILTVQNAVQEKCAANAVKQAVIRALKD